MCSSLCVSDGNIRDAVDRHLVVQAAVVSQNTTVAVRGILAEADIGADEELREAASDELNSLDDWALGIISGTAKGILGARLHGDTKEHDGSQSLVDERLEEASQSADADLELARKRGHFDHVILAVGNKDGVDEHRLGQLALRLPGSSQRMKVAAVKLAADVASDAHAGGCGAGITRHGARNVRCSVIEC